MGCKCVSTMILFAALRGYSCVWTLVLCGYKCVWLLLYRVDINGYCLHVCEYCLWYCVDIHVCEYCLWYCVDVHVCQYRLWYCVGVNTVVLCRCKCVWILFVRTMCGYKCVWILWYCVDINMWMLFVILCDISVCGYCLRYCVGVNDKIALGMVLAFSRIMIYSNSFLILTLTWPLYSDRITWVRLQWRQELCTI